MHYTLKDNSGEVLDSSEGKEPLAFIQGIGNIIIGLEEELEGKAVGDKISATVAPEKGYGIRSEENVHVVPLSGFQADGEEKLVEGMHRFVSGLDSTHHRHPSLYSMEPAFWATLPRCTVRWEEGLLL